MALKPQFKSLETFSMSSMTDVIFLLLIFFMVTSTVIFPGAIEVNLPQSSETTQLKPLTEVYLDSLKQLHIVIDRNDSTGTLNKPQDVTKEELLSSLKLVQQQDSLRAVALYADRSLPYGDVVEILDMAARANLKMVLSTRAQQAPASSQEQSNTKIVETEGAQNNE